MKVGREGARMSAFALKPAPSRIDRSRKELRGRWVGQSVRDSSSALAIDGEGHDNSGKWGEGKFTEVHHTHENE